MEGIDTPSKIDLRFAEDKIVFTISECSLDKKYSFWNLTKEEAKEFIGRIKHLEKMTWKQISALDRKHGLTVENSDSESFSMIHSQNNCDRKMVEQYYFHMRIIVDGVFRIFGYQRDQLFCITHIDSRGIIHH